MKSLLAITGVVIIAMMLAGPTVQAKDIKYIGVQGCTKACHKKESVGDQRSAWRKSKHSLAFKTLGTNDAKSVAKKLGILDNPQNAEECLICHTTGYGVNKKLFKKKFKIEDGVQCEACHGPGDNYRKKKTMMKILRERGVDRKGDSPTAKKTGLTFPDETTCKNCHVSEINWKGKVFKNPNYKKFVFDEAFEKMKHRVPDEKRASIVKKRERKE